MFFLCIQLHLFVLIIQILSNLFREKRPEKVSILM